jgi:GT2 family glycosyltransferase
MPYVASEHPSVTTIVLHYHHFDDTVRCITSLLGSGYPNQSVLVVNGDEADFADPEHLRQMLPSSVRVLVAGENLGYAGGNNLGIAAALASSDLVWILNPDAVATEGCLSRLVQTCQSRPNVGILGSLVVHGGSTPARVWTGGGMIDWSDGAATDHKYGGELLEERHVVRPYKVDFVVGASMLIRREVFETVGLLPEEYFLYFEETDFNLKAQKSGWISAVEPRARVDHYKRSTGKLPATYYLYYYIRNRMLFGMRFTDATNSDLRQSLTPFIDAWRAKVQAADGKLTSAFDRIVAMALEDGDAGVCGRRDDLPPLAR